MGILPVFSYFLAAKGPANFLEGRGLLKGYICTMCLWKKHRAGREHERGGAAGEQIGWEKGRGSLRERWTAWAKLNDSTILLCSGNGKSPPGEYSACKSIELLSIITMLPNTPPQHSPFGPSPAMAPSSSQASFFPSFFSHPCICEMKRLTGRLAEGHGRLFEPGPFEAGV